MKYFILLIVMLSSCVQKKKELNVFTQNPRIIIPIIINNKEHSFLFDTGAEVSVVSERFTKSIGLKQTKDHILIKGLRKEAIGVLTEPVKITIANCQIMLPIVSTKTFLDGKFFDGVLGLDIIKQFSWLFDFEKKQFWVSKNSIVDSANTHDSSFMLPYYFRKEDSLMFVNLSLNETDSIECVFDTGATIDLSFPPNITLQADLFLSEEYLKIESLSHRFNTSKMLNIDGKEDSATIPYLKKVSLAENIKLHNIDSISLTLIKTLLQKNYITFGFVQHFSQMYIDPLTQRIILKNEDCEKISIKSTQTNNKIKQWSQNITSDSVKKASK